MKSLIKKSIVIENIWNFDDFIYNFQNLLQAQEILYIEKLKINSIENEEKKICRIIENFVNSSFNFIDSNFWKKMDKFFIEITEKADKDIGKILQSI